jgi:hypothetical protein
MTHHLHKLIVHGHTFEVFADKTMRIKFPGTTWYSKHDSDFKQKVIQVGRFWREVTEYIENTER